MVSIYRSALLPVFSSLPFQTAEVIYVASSLLWPPYLLHHDIPIPTWRRVGPNSSLAASRECRAPQPGPRPRQRLGQGKGPTEKRHRTTRPGPGGRRVTSVSQRSLLGVVGLGLPRLVAGKCLPFSSSRLPLHTTAPLLPREKGSP